MAIWKEQQPIRKDTFSASLPSQPIPMAAPVEVSPVDLPRRTQEQNVNESLIAADLTVEGKIEGAGNIRVAGRFKGDINVQGHLTIEVGAKVTGGVRAGTVVIAGELEGNIEAATRVELLDTGALTGDVKAGSLTVAAGSRMRGNADFGWDEKGVQRGGLRMESAAAS